jgi:hypothetical protein
MSAPSFSPEAKLIVASNIAVAEAVWALSRKGESGHFESNSQMVQKSIAIALKNFDSMAEKLFPATQL